MKNESFTGLRSRDVGAGLSPPGDALPTRIGRRQNGKRPRIVIARPQRGRGNLGKAVTFSPGVPCYPPRSCEIAPQGHFLALRAQGATSGFRPPRNDKLGGHCLFNIGPHFPPVQCREGHAAPLQCTNGNFPRSIFSFPLPSCSSSTHNVINIFVLWKKHKNPRGNPKRSLIIPSRRDLTNAGKCDKIKAQRESGAFKNTDPVFGIARQDRFVADRLGTPAFAAGAPFFFRRGREENQNV